MQFGLSRLLGPGDDAAPRHRFFTIGLTTYIFLAAGSFSFANAADALVNEATVPTYHADAERSGHYVFPGLTWTTAPNMRMDRAFDGRVAGNIYAQPLYWHPAGANVGLVIVATEDNSVTALDSKTGVAVWERRLGPPVSGHTACGNIKPLGITGTPVIDESRAALYLDAMVNREDGPRHVVFGLSLADGSVLPGWPVDVAESLRAIGMNFDPPAQNQRGALTLIDDRLYLPFGGHFGGGCGRGYHGWVVGMQVDKPSVFAAWTTVADGAGVWAPGGASYDGHDLFVATGYKFGDDEWGGQQAVLRLPLDLVWQRKTENYFAPEDWSRSGALGVANPLPLDLPDGASGTALLLALKVGGAYLFDRNNLGGIGHPAAEQQLGSSYIFSPAAYRSERDMLVVFQSYGPNCPGHRDNGLTALRISAGPPATMRREWCNGVNSGGAPIVTTSDERADPIVWLVGAEGDGRLHGLRGDTGQEIVTSEPIDIEPDQLRHFVTILSAGGRLYVAGDGHVFAFGLSH
jgi:hypothetical protein